MFALLRDHSKTILGLTLGPALLAYSLWAWTNGGNLFDIVTIIGAIQLDKGMEGVLNMWLRETAKPED